MRNSNKVKRRLARYYRTDWRKVFHREFNKRIKPMLYPWQRQLVDKLMQSRGKREVTYLGRRTGKSWLLGAPYGKA